MSIRDDMVEELMSQPSREMKLVIEPDSHYTGSPDLDLWADILPDEEVEELRRRKHDEAS